ncbi:MAG: acylphosphatase [Chloroflexota bacterium]
MSESNLASFRALVTGRVQGVSFRDFVARIAKRLDLAGYASNLTDGETVEVRAEGEREKLEKLIEYLKVGPPRAGVKGVSIEWGEYQGDFRGFEVR